MIMGSFWDHRGMVLRQSVGQCFALFSLFRDMFGQTFVTLLEHFWKIVSNTIEIPKSNETLPDHFSTENKASHEVERQIRRFLFSLDSF